MIGKVGLGRYAKGILTYCYYDKPLSAKQIKQLGTKDVRGELVYIQNLALQKLPDGRFDVENLSRQFLDNMEMSRRLTKFIWHQSFSFPPGKIRQMKRSQKLLCSLPKTSDLRITRWLCSCILIKRISIFMCAHKGGDFGARDHYNTEIKII